MNSYQRYLFDKFEKFRQKPTWHPYPPYHTGDYLEEYFIKYFLENNISTNRYFIPISWTSTYIHNGDNPNNQYLQNELDSLDSSYNYFTVSTHDEAPRQNLPKNTIRYAAAGRLGAIPIPLGASKIPKNLIKYNINKKYLASFVGSLTHPIRSELIKTYVNNQNFYFAYKQWNISVKQDSLLHLIDKTQESFFGLAPRGYSSGYGLNYRLFEIMQLGSVPIYITDYFWLPWEDEIDWNSICVLCKNNEINDLENRLYDIIKTNKYENMLQNINKIYDTYFTAENITKKIIEKVKKDE